MGKIRIGVVAIAFLVVAGVLADYFVYNDFGMLVAVRDTWWTASLRAQRLNNMASEYTNNSEASEGNGLLVGAGQLRDGPSPGTVAMRPTITNHSHSLEADGLQTSREDAKEVQSSDVGIAMHAPSEFHFCRVREMTFPTSPGPGNVTKRIRYPCEGKEYDSFAEQMLNYATERQAADKNLIWWGKREYPLPENSDILVIGNSHTRQTLNALLCQYAEHITRIQDFGRLNNNHLPGGFEAFHFSNNATITLISNSPLVFVKAWKQFLELYGLHRDIESYDAVVLGFINQYTPGVPSNTTYYGEMERFVHGNPELYDLEHWHTLGIDIQQMVHAYSGPVVVLPMFSLYNRPHLDNVKSIVDKWKNSDSSSSRAKNIKILNGRAHVEVLGECASLKPWEFDICRMGTQGNIGNQHRCTGAKGGHADLLAWDLIETLYNVMGIHRSS